MVGEILGFIKSLERPKTQSNQSTMVVGEILGFQGSRMAIKHNLISLPWLEKVWDFKSLNRLKHNQINL